MAATPIVEHVRALLSEPRKVSHEGKILHVIPGPECDHCKGTGYVRTHGRPVGRFGPHMSNCPSCRRDPEKWLHDVVNAKFVAAAIKQDPSILDIV